MSAFDDEFGLFGEDADETERRPTLGARTIASGETVIDEIEPEDARPPRTARREPTAPRGRFDKKGPPRRHDQPRSPRSSSDPWASQRRATDLLGFLGKRLVAKPDVVNVELFIDEEGKSVIELVVDPDDLGKVIGRNGRVAQALRTIVRATAEDRVSVDILDIEEAAAPIDDGDAEE